MSLTKLFQNLKGGEGSGNYGHAGRLGRRGGSAPKGGGLVYIKDIVSLAKRIQGKYDYDDVGIRVQDSDYGLKVGDTIEHQSSVWVEGEETSEQLNGVSAIDVEIASQGGATSHGGYEGNVIFVLGSNEYGNSLGEDAGEIILVKPVVLDIIYK